MLLDVVVLIIIIIAAFKGLSKGLVVGVFSFIAFVVGLAAALKLSAVAAVYIGSAVNISGRLLPVLAFFAVFIVVVLLIKLGAKIIEKVLQLSTLGWLNRLGGIIFYMLIYLFIFSIILFYAESLTILKPETLQNSVSYRYLQPLAPKIMNGMGIIIPYFKNMFEELLKFFQNVAGKSPKQYTLLQSISYSSFLI